jgi:hypothetical protein
MSAKMVQPLPVYATPVRYFRSCLGVSYQFGMRLAKLGVLKPDAELDDGRPIYLLDWESIRQARGRISAYRQTVTRARHNLSTSLAR